MKISNALLNRCNHACELCATPAENLQAYIVPTRSENIDENAVVLCGSCMQYIQDNDYSNANYFHFLTGSIWNEVSSVKVLSHKILTKLKDQVWAQDALEGAYLTDEELEWSNSEDEAVANEVIHKDAYGTVLQHGDTVFLTESLNVKGANFMASKGTKVSKIRLVHDNAEQIEGRIEGVVIVILTKFVRKG
jgi:protein PhnA